MTVAQLMLQLKTVQDAGHGDLEVCRIVQQIGPQVEFVPIATTYLTTAIDQDIRLILD